MEAKLIMDEFSIASKESYQNKDLRVLNESDTFAIFDSHGDINFDHDGIQGIYYGGTRYISRLVLGIEGARPTILSSNIRENNDMLSVDMTNPNLGSDESFFAQGQLHIKRNTFVKNGACYTKLMLYNFGKTNLETRLIVRMDADFKDIFEIRGSTRSNRGDSSLFRAVDDEFVKTYNGLDGVEREVVVKTTPQAEFIESQGIIFNVSLLRGEITQLTMAFYFRSDDAEEHEEISYEQSLSELEHDMSKERELMGNIFTSNEQFTHWLNRSKTDLLSLLARTSTGLYPYAGVPWYNTAFGRDGILTAYETLWIAPDITRQSLEFLAAHQATELDPKRDAEPGKILHETRKGEMANTGEVPFSLYYGTIDATPLFIMLAGAYFERTGDLETCKKLWPSLEKALNWIDEYGDLDGDGFVEYQHKAENGLTNQGWKDSFDSISYDNGDLAEAPIALCEVQAYVYAAKKSASKIAKSLKFEVANKLDTEAEELKVKFNETFWDEEMRCFVLALDANKKPCRVKNSNAGHTLFTGIATQENAEKLAATLTSVEMFTGWGIRTLGLDAPRYNPMSYHNGSVWPHDVALIAEGFSQYDLQPQALKLVTAMFDASLFLDMQRMPELFCGFARRDGEGPTSYPVACSPQAWSVGAVFMFFKACLKINIEASTKTVLFNKPSLPDYLDYIRIDNIYTADGSIDLEINRHKSDVGIVVNKKPDSWSVVIVK
ncbi:amylo-alpha-1,6-glucosidase [Fulvivirga ligni]|uniref:amylo-alpha-1,6-glucosidase n=1 Tax=Fulvivirga ligni TaxID=2904246 RepID=UPI001F1B73C9|nr:glycogen debranching N-terminal domain-containing protein [Fulvivirga ligni]UII19728.1 amylo-alpha-1,6-glucosidase [Fulvivirga ligni]